MFKSMMKREYLAYFVLMATLLCILPGAKIPGPYSPFEFNDSLNPPLDSIKKVNIITAGDAMAHLPQITSAYDKNSKTYDFFPVFQHLKPILNRFDLSIVNYETTCGGEPYKGYPQFSAPDTMAYGLKKAGFNFFVNANNHSVDRGKKGIIRTIDVFDRYKIPYTGTFKNKTQRDSMYPYIWEKDSIRFAILNYTYGTNGLKVPSPCIVNMIDTAQMHKDLDKAKQDSVDVIMVAIHWGSEYVREPGKFQENMADFLFEHGTDVIIGSHPHVVQPIEIKEFNYHGKKKRGLVIWSLGNLVSNQQRHYTDGGILAGFNIEKHFYNDSIAINSVTYLPFWVYRSYSPYKYRILPVYQFENDDSTYKLSEEKKKLFNRFIKETRAHLKDRDTANIKEYFPARFHN